MSVDSWHAVADLESMTHRARMLQSIRAFFAAAEVLEVETPALSAAAVTDLQIESFSTRMGQQSLYLQTSPEYPMKRLLASGFPSIYQICKVYRREEQGPHHNPEFSLLEWYRLGFDYRQLMVEVVSLLQQLSQRFSNSATAEMTAVELSYQQAFLQTIGLDPLNTTVEQCRQLCQQQQIEIPQGMSTHQLDEWLDWLLTQAVAPAFEKDRFTLLYDYPASQCALAKISDDGLRAQRFEVFYGELELANGFTELTDAAEQRRRFEADNQQRQQAGLSAMPIDQRFLAALQAGLPESAGVAIGLDRLQMVLCDKASISEVLAFPFSRA
ncbi:MAG: EF-P lysine aminoacylase EpmA [Gammaproteobacteria bacterium]|nr:EF-P lysine aminoacylase EpmA [Gammaproteobacteria bacterium]